MTIGEQIKYIRSRRNITQNQLAQIVGVHPVTIRKYETNKLQPKKEHLSKIADALWVSPLVFRGFDANNMKMRTVGDLMSILMFLHKLHVLVPNDEYTEVKVSPYLREYFAFVTRKTSTPISDGVIDYLNDEVKKQYFRWAHLYDGCMKKREDYKYEHSEYTDEQYKNAFSEEEELLMTVEMALAMNLENLVEFKPE